MKVLVSAIACNPVQGSESQVGWNAVKLLAHEHEVWVITHIRNKAEIEQAVREDKVPGNLHFSYHGQALEWHRNRMLARLQSWNECRCWSNGLLALALDMHGSVGFDLAHHVTISAWRIPSPLWRLPVPFIWGPVGGAGEFPPSLLSHLSPASIVFELLRFMANRWGQQSRELQNCLRYSFRIVASNSETAAFFKALGADPQRLRILPPVWFEPETVLKLGSAPSSSKTSGPLHLFGGGNMIGSKGAIFALMAARLLKERGIPFHYLLGGTGPETPYLKKKIRQWNLSDCVDYHDNLQGEDYIRALQSSHIYLLPSFRENAGITMMEAMLARAVPVIVHASAQGEIVTDTCGFRIPVAEASEMAAGLADAIEKLDRDRALLAQMGDASHDRIADTYSRELCARELRSLYDEVAK